MTDEVVQYEACNVVRQSEDAKEGVAAFLEKNELLTGSVDKTHPRFPRAPGRNRAGAGASRGP